MRRPQFSIRSLLWLTLVVAAFLGGIAYGKRLARQEDAEWFAKQVEKVHAGPGGPVSRFHLKDWPVPLKDWPVPKETPRERLDGGSAPRLLR